MVGTEARDLTFGYRRDRLIFEHASFRLGLEHEHRNSGRVTAIVGASGCGKSTLLKLIAGLLKPVSGSIAVGPPNTTVSYLPQEVVLFEHLSRRTNARYFQHINAHRDAFDEKLFQHLASKLRLSDALESSDSVIQLSGGERQRLALLRAMSIRPSLLLLDEPCNGLDVAVKVDFLATMREVADEFQIGIVYATHHRDEVILASDEVAYLWSQSDAASSVSVRTVGAMLREPVTVEMAQFMSSEPLNILECEIRTSGLCVAEGDVPITVIRSAIPTAGRYKLVFSPSVVNLDCEHGVSVSFHAESSEYFFYHATFTGTLIIAKRTQTYGQRLLLSGEGLLFSVNGSFVKRVDLNSQALGSEGSF